MKFLIEFFGTLGTSLTILASPQCRLDEKSDHIAIAEPLFLLELIRGK